ncbi:fungal pheromone mating factor STE2 GPCR-domain-containing protein [Mariannaea sp. PMI_226]|nr:fungal pheromone mating factor STE2 GPCR-domain-containing protein [Mariannaea sp. PMI_226]
MIGDFNPFTQNVTVFAPDGKTTIPIPLEAINDFYTYSINTSLNYGIQLGACLIMLFVLLAMTPSAKYRRPSSILHISGLLICIIRMGLLAAYFTSHFNNFYAVWASDYSRVPQIDFNVSVAATTFSLLLVIAIEAALMHQAWTMVRLWPTLWKVLVSVVSAVISLYTIGWRIAFTIVQNETIINLVPPVQHRWVIQWAVIANLISICWFCFIFNLKLIHHLISNRGILPSYKAMTPMEVLIVTNGILMAVPVIFAGLEWAHFTNFESASLTLTSVAIILPLGTLTAQRFAHSANHFYPTSSSAVSGRGTNTSNGQSVFVPKKPSSTATQFSIVSHCEAGGASSHNRRGSDALELGKLSEQGQMYSSQVRIYRNLTQHEERV